MRTKDFTDVPDAAKRIFGWTVYVEYGRGKQIGLCFRWFHMRPDVIFHKITNEKIEQGRMVELDFDLPFYWISVTLDKTKW